MRLEQHVKIVLPNKKDPFIELKLILESTASKFKIDVSNILCACYSVRMSHNRQQLAMLYF